MTTTGHRPTQRLEPNTAAYHRPPWMTDKQWQAVSANMTEHWLELLENEARKAAAASTGS